MKNIGVGIGIAIENNIESDTDTDCDTDSESDTDTDEKGNALIRDTLFAPSPFRPFAVSYLHRSFVLSVPSCEHSFAVSVPFHQCIQWLTSPAPFCLSVFRA